MKIKKLCLILFLTIFLILIFGGISSAQPNLEVNYPEFGGQKVTPYLPDYVQYIYYAVIGISGIIALVMLIGAGTKYIMSAGNPEKMKDAREQIKAAIFGLIILFASYLIINIINPELTILRLTPTDPSLPELSSGVYFCTKKVSIKQIWNATKEFYYKETTKERQKQIKEKLTPLMNDVGANCSIVATHSKRKSRCNNALCFRKF